MTAFVRSFIAIELSEALRASLQAEIVRLRAQLPKDTVKWVRPEGMHLTLKFLGDVPRDQLEAIKTATAEAVAQQAAFKLRAEALGCFYRGQSPTVLWVGLKGELTALTALRDRIEARVSPLGYPTEQRPFSPHLTLGRVQPRAKQGMQALARLVEAEPQAREFGAWRAERVALMQSILQPSGAEYQPLALIPLQDHES